MKLLKTLSQFNLRQSQIQYDSYIKSFISLLIIFLTGIVIWALNSYFGWNLNLLLETPEKKIYAVLFLLLIWVLKLLLFDLNTPIHFRVADAALQKKLHQLQTQVAGAVRFLKKTNIHRHSGVTKLYKLPWYLLIGPAQAGKTSFLSCANIRFILQRQFQPGSIPSSNDQCDWWVTRDACIIDVPGNYLSKYTSTNSVSQKDQSLIWRCLIHLIRKAKGQHGVRGILLALPLPQLMLKSNSKQYHFVLKDLSQRLTELQNQFSASMNCYLIVTKCDLLPGFNEFFSELSNEEINQAWGITFSAKASLSYSSTTVIERFDHLIKKLNEQLLWRLHHERNPMARPYIKDFPLQVEKLKELTSNLLKKLLTDQPHLHLKGIYLTSALQPETKPDISVDEINHSQRALQLFKAPKPKTRAYFIKQFLTHGLIDEVTHLNRHRYKWQRRIVLTIAIFMISSTALILGKNFQQGVKQTQALQNYLVAYQRDVQKNQNALEHLILATNLLDNIQKFSLPNNPRLSLHYLLSFYSFKAKRQATLVYQNALQTIYLPAVKNYLEDYLKMPVNKNAEQVYATLKAYIMLSDPTYLESEFISNLLQQILPNQMTNHCIKHLSLALQQFKILSIDQELIWQTRKYLQALSSSQLAYVILKGMNHNNMANKIDLGKQNNDAIFLARQIDTQVPHMFTAKAFTQIMSQDILLSAQEAITGNWVLGEIHDSEQVIVAQLAEQLRITYINNYIDVWESLLANMQIITPKNIEELDEVVVKLISNDSPLLQLLQTLHQNTYFEPIRSASPKLHEVSLLLARHDAAGSSLYHIFSGLQDLHAYLQTILNANDHQKAAFNAIRYHMLNNGTPDALTNLRLIAEKNPTPIRQWLNTLSNQAWHFLMQDAGHYLDTSWRENVVKIYEKDIANRYPFNLASKKEVNLKQFTQFFSYSGVLLSFYRDYLQPFVNETSRIWHWKNTLVQKLPFHTEPLQQIQKAWQINHLFFPNGDDKLFIQFALQPYEFSDQIKKVQLNINDKKIIDQSDDDHNSHVITWPNSNREKSASYALTLINNKTIHRYYRGEWGWFKLINQTLENIVSKKELLLNFSLNNSSAKYLLFTENSHNPFLTLNLHQFKLSPQLIDQTIITGARDNA